MIEWMSLCMNNSLSIYSADIDILHTTEVISKVSSYINKESITGTILLH